MLRKVDLDAHLPKKVYKARLPSLQTHLHELQRACWQARLSPILVFEGWETSGRAAAIDKLTERLEPRGFQLHTVREPRSFEAQLPWLWRFWTLIPNYGEMAIFDYSWYSRSFAKGVRSSAAEKIWRRQCRDIVEFEETLTADRYVIIKFFLHLSRKEKKLRLEALEEDPLTRWRAGPEAWEGYHQYDDYHSLIERSLALTHSLAAPWTVLPGTDRRLVRIRVLETLIAALENRLESCPETRGGDE